MRRAIWAGILLMTGQPGVTGTICDPLDHLDWQRPSLTAGALGATFCDTAVEPGGHVFFCGWAHPYRASAARAGLDNLKARVERCFSTNPAPLPAGRVNHPDSHDVINFTTSAAKISISLKDKSGLGKTYVFLRILPE